MLPYHTARHPPVGAKTLHACFVVRRIWSLSPSHLSHPSCCLSSPGWRLTDSDVRNVEAAQNYLFGVAPCDGPGNFTIEAGHTLTLQPKSEASPCGFVFGISFR